MDIALDRYAVFGNPIGHSKSPFIHTQFAKELNESLQYEAILAPLDGFADSWHNFVAAGGKGANVTVPFKEQAYRLADKLSERALQAGAVNTLYIDESGAVCADNTDGIGLVSDLLRLGVTLNNTCVLLIGAGGASRGVIGPLLEAGVRHIVLTNRTEEKAKITAKQFGNNVTACSFETIPEQVYKVVINATSAGLSGERPAIAEKHLVHSILAYDMLYADKPTGFLTWAKQHGVPMQADGLGMLVAQAAAAFYIWRKKTPNIENTLQLLKQQL